MGNALGVYTDEEVNGLTNAEREELNQCIIAALKETGILKSFLRDKPNLVQALKDIAPLPKK